MNEQEETQTCKATKDDGSPCESPFVGEDGYCSAHRPGGREEMRRRGKKGKASRRSGGRTKFDPDELPPLNSHENVQLWHERIARAVAAGEIDNRVGNTIARHLKGWIEAEGERFTLKKVRELEEKVGDLKEALADAQKQPWK